MRIGIVMDPLETVRLDHDTTYVLMREAVRRGHEVVHIAPAGVGAEGGRAVLFGRPVRTTDDPTQPFAVEPARRFEDDAWDAVLIRTDPPFDADYLAVTWLLDLLPPRVFVMNRPAGLREANEKLAAQRFADLGPMTCITQDPAVLDDFRRRLGGDVVVKPLDGFGGSGVFLVRDADPNRDALLRAVTRGGGVKAVAQEVVAGASGGDKRILLLDGEPLGAVLRRQTGGGFVHNLAAGGEALRAEINAEDRRICERLAPWLREHGLWFAGIDVLGGRLIEVNVTSPTCVQEINRLDGVALERPILDFIEGRCRAAS